MIGEAITGSHLIGWSDHPPASLSTVPSAAGWLGAITPVISHTIRIPQSIIAYGQPSPQWPRSSDSAVMECVHLMLLYSCNFLCICNTCSSQEHRRVDYLRRPTTGIQRLNTQLKGSQRLSSQGLAKSTVLARLGEPVLWLGLAD